MSGRAVLLSPGGDDAERAKRSRLQLSYCLKIGLTVTALAGSLADACRMVADGLADAVVATPRDLHEFGLHVASTWTERPMVIPQGSLNPVEETPPHRRRALPLHGPFSD